MNSDKLNVLYINPDYSLGGASHSLLQLIKSVGNEVNPIVLFPCKDVAYDLFVKSGIECHIYPFLILHQFEIVSIKKSFPKIWKWHRVEKWRNYLGCMCFIRRHVLKGRKLDLIHTNSSVTEIGVYLSKAFGIKHIWHVRELLDLHFHLECDVYLGLAHLRKQINKADARIAISNCVKKFMYMPESNTFVLHNAIRQLSDACYESNKGKYVVFIANYIVKEKGPQLAVEAFCESNLGKDGYVLKMAGNCSGEEMDKLLNIARTYGCSGCIEFLPYQNDVKPLLANASAFMMCSEFEALGRVTAEAMFFGCPVVGRATGGTLDLIKDGATGYLFDSVDECAVKLRKTCLENQSEMIRRAQEFVKSEMSQEVYGPKLMEIYRQIV